MRKELLEKSIFQMTGQDFIDLVSHVADKEPSKREKQRLIKGRTTLANELGIAVTTVIKWENAGIIKPMNKVGRVLIYDLDQIRMDMENAGRV